MIKSWRLNTDSILKWRLRIYLFRQCRSMTGLQPPSFLGTGNILLKKPFGSGAGSMAFFCRSSSTSLVMITCFSSPRILGWWGGLLGGIEVNSNLSPCTTWCIQVWSVRDLHACKWSCRRPPTGAITTAGGVEAFWFIIEGIVLISACLVVSHFAGMQRGFVF